MNGENQTENGFVKRYTAFLEEFELTPNSLALKLGDKGKVKYHNWKAGESEPNSESLRLIAKHFPISIDWLIHGDGEMYRDGPDKEPTDESQVIVDLKAQIYIKDEKILELAQKLSEAVDDLREAQKEIRETRRELSEVSRDFREMMKQNFPGSSSHTTAKPNRRSRKRRQTTQESNHQIVPQLQNFWRNPIGFDQDMVDRGMMPANEVKENSTLNLLRSYPGVSNAHCFSIQL